VIWKRPHTCYHAHTKATKMVTFMTCFLLNLLSSMLPLCGVVQGAARNPAGLVRPVPELTSLLLACRKEC